MNQSVLFIEGTYGFLNEAIVKKLEHVGFKVIRIEDDMDVINQRRNEAEILLYYPSGHNTRIELVTRYMTDICREEHKTLCILGELHNIAAARQADEENKIYATYPRPIDINELVTDMQKIADMYREYERVKTILIIDDDRDFLTVMSNWLKSVYKVDGVRSGVEALIYLENMRPDLILLDYEMPEFDGYQVMDMIRKNPLTALVPIIFLTGKNEKESVLRIIKRKPDGYLLKSMKKEELLDALERFFADSILSQKNSKYR